MKIKIVSLLSLCGLFLLSAHLQAAEPVPLKTTTTPAGKTDKPVKVFLLVGQSNMVGAGTIPNSERSQKRNGGKGTLEYLVTSPEVKDKKQFAHLVGPGGLEKDGWIARGDVWIANPPREKNGLLTVGYGGGDDNIGPELQFGHSIGDYYDEQVLLIKLSWGGKSVGTDFRPPSAGGETGEYYKTVLAETKKVLDNLGTLFPEYKKQGFELVGIAWHQGWNDRVNQAHNDAYEENLSHLIKDWRKALGKPNLPFVIAETGMSGHEEKHPRALSLMAAQAAVAKRPEFKGNVAFVGTKDFYRTPEESPSNQQFHWNRNAETYFLIGNGLAEGMKKLLK